MSTVTPTTRRNRGLIVRGLDTKFSVDEVATALAYGGLHTPPQSAHESRRPSTQSSWSDTPYSATASAFVGSLPSTPVHRTQPGLDSFMHVWPEAEMVSSANRHLGQHVTDNGFSTQTYPAMVGPVNLPYSNALRHTDAEAYHLQLNTGVHSNEGWVRSTQTMDPFAVQAPCLGSELFPMTQSLSSESTFSGSTFQSSESSFQELSEHLKFDTVRSVSGHDVSQGLLYQQPQIIIPSQLSPQDAYDHSQFDDYAGLDHSGELLEGSFASSTTFRSFELVDTPSPMHAYFDASEDEGYLLVKPEVEKYCARTTRSRLGGQCSATSKIRASKRSRKEDRCWPRHETAGIDVTVKFEAGKTRKMFACTYLKKDGSKCVSKFERSEHLKRHVGSHTDSRPYACPLEGCNQRTQRPDNACDHFKTHLRPPKPGKRNTHAEWPVLRDAILETYPDQKKAKKILDNLADWIKRGMPDNAARSKGSCREDNWSV